MMKINGEMNNVTVWMQLCRSGFVLKDGGDGVHGCKTDEGNFDVFQKKRGKKHQTVLDLNGFPVLKENWKT